jgi:hypothetical protein
MAGDPYASLTIAVFAIPTPDFRFNQGGLKLNDRSGGDQKHKKDRQQHRRYEPLAKIEFVGDRHRTAFSE